MNKNPLISVLLPLYNEPISLAKQAIDSILNQTFSHLEVILLLDNPQNTELINLIQDYEGKDNRVITHINSSNKGLPETLNAGIHKAKGKYIVLLNNDIKVITPDWLEEMLGICQRNEVGIVGAKLLYYDKTIQHAGVVIGMGGIASAKDALEFILAGATAVSVGTANFINPATTLEVVDGIKTYMERHQINDINELIGCVK